MKIIIPELALVVLVGASGSGKSSFARKHFKATEVISSDFCRGLVADDENDQSATKDAFEILHYVAGKRLAAGRLTVIDATSVQGEARRPLIELARAHHCLLVAIVFNVPEKVCQERNQMRPDRQFGPHVVRNQSTQMKRSMRGLQEEGFHHVFFLNGVEQVDTVEIERQRLWTNLRHEHGPFDIIGDVHGCFDELHTLLGELGYALMEEKADDGGAKFRVTHPEGRKAIFLGDLVDRGPATPKALRLVMDMVSDDVALCVPGNHDVKLLRKLKGRNVQVRHGLAETLAQLEQETEEFKGRVLKFLDKLISHYVLDDGKLVVAHAGMKEALQGRSSRVVREFGLYGETTGEIDEFGLPVRYNWAAEYRGKAMVVYGHTPVLDAEWLNRTINIDTGCVFGGKLTALRYPERTLVAVPARATYADSVRPLQPVAQEGKLTAQQQQDNVLDMEDVSGKRIIQTRLQQNITIREENAIAALEVMSRFASDPKWLIYLPPTISPSETSQRVGLLEYPVEAFDYYRSQGIERVVCEEKHMGSRAVVIVCRDAEAARARFGVTSGEIGICYTRTGRRFFDDARLEAEMLARVRAALDAANFWEKHETNWVCLDCELMPWSVKAQSLLLHQYAAVGAAARLELGEAVGLLEQTAQRGIETEEVEKLLGTYRRKQALAGQYVEAYRHYCWPVESIADLKLAPFHVLATQGKTYFDRDHGWHMETIAEVCRQDKGLLLATPYLVVEVNDEASMDLGVKWWEGLTARGGEGMVVKPFSFVARGSRGLVQPAVKCRGREYLRIIYGPEYDVAANLERLRARGLGTKRSLALREFSLGMEALERFVQGEALRRVHECVFGVLALESEPVDPRL